MDFYIRPNVVNEITLPIKVYIPKEWRGKWYKYQYNGTHNWDVDECQECGWISTEHLQELSKFVYNSITQSK